MYYVEIERFESFVGRWPVSSDGGICNKNFMKHYYTSCIIASALAGVLTVHAQTDVKPISSSKPLPVVPDQPAQTITVIPVETPSSVVVQTRAVSDETLAVLRDIRSIAPQKEPEIQAALKVESDAEANLILDTILLHSKDEIRASKADRLQLEVVNRTEQDRNDYVAYMTNRLQGRSAITDAPPSFRSRIVAVPTEKEVTVYKPRFYGPGRRVITYRTRAEIPPVLIANGQLKRVEIAEVGGSPFRNDLILVDDMPSTYIQPDAYAVSYVVNPDTEITRSDILFEQGTTNFADPYSYDVVVDLAMAMKNPALANQAFIIEGHASAEGDYSSNLRLSQARAERIAREMIRFGVSSSQLVPVGYGESEAIYPSTAGDPLRAQDRRVTVFALQN